jgi:hypothetical protein
MNAASRVMQRSRRLAASTVVTAGVLCAVGESDVKADDTTVQSLLTQGYTVVGVVLSQQAGAGVFLVKADSLMFCDIAETPTSPTVATRYCKPVK